MNVLVRSVDEDREGYMLELAVDGVLERYRIKVLEGRPKVVTADRSFWDRFLGAPPLATDLLRIVAKIDEKKHVELPLRLESHDEASPSDVRREFRRLLVELACTRADSPLGSAIEAETEARLRAIAARLPEKVVQEEMRSLDEMRPIGEQRSLGREQDPWTHPHRAPRAA